MIKTQEAKNPVPLISGSRVSEYSPKHAANETRGFPLIESEKTLIVIPAFNEAASIGKVLSEIKQQVSHIPILVINDGSSDRTAAIAEKHGARVITLPYNSGYGVALQTGFIYALQNKFTTVLHMDADGQHDPHFIKPLLQEIKKDDVDVVIGSRFLGSCDYKTSLPKRLGMIIFGSIASTIIHQKVTDPTSGFQAIKGKTLEFAAGDFYPPDYPDADFIIVLHRHGFRIREIPVTMHPNAENKSMHRGHKTLYYVFKMVLSIVVTLLREKPKK